MSEKERHKILKLELEELELENKILDEKLSIQKSNGKKFISDDSIDNLISNIKKEFGYE